MTNLMNQLTKNSVLGNQSSLYLTKSNERGSILDMPSKGLLELWPAGYTHPSNRDNQSRQSVYADLWERAVVDCTENDLYPFGKEGHNIVLEPDPNNEHDGNAIHVVFKAAPGSPLAHLDGRDLGFIPKKINTMILKNMDMINGGRILKVKSNFHKKYYTAKVILGYNDTTFSPLSKSTINRFRAILDE